jgi:hypothetical protein
MVIAAFNLRSQWGLGVLAYIASGRVYIFFDFAVVMGA